MVSDGGGRRTRRTFGGSSLVLFGQKKSAVLPAFARLLLKLSNVLRFGKCSTIGIHFCFCFVSVTTVYWNFLLHRNTHFDLVATSSFLFLSSAIYQIVVKVYLKPHRCEWGDGGLLLVRPLKSTLEVMQPYLRYHRSVPGLPERLQPSGISRQYGLRTCVIKALFYFYSPFVNRTTKISGKCQL